MFPSLTKLLLLTSCSISQLAEKSFATDHHSSSQMVEHGHLREHPTWIMMAVKVNHLLLTLNSAANIVIYSFKVALDMTSS